nr:MAG TPA: hypothetical protein [Caudoviricetes sp.]
MRIEWNHLLLVSNYTFYFFFSPWSMKVPTSPSMVNNDHILFPTTPVSGR